MIRFLSTSPPPIKMAYAAVVAGAGPAGLAVVGNLLEKNPNGKILWVDPDFKGGRFSKQWREVPSNTKVKLFRDFAMALQPFRDVVDKTPCPNALTALENLDQDRGCPISLAADMCLMLTHGLSNNSQVVTQLGQVTGASLNSMKSTWTVEVCSTRENSVTTFRADRLILCTGSRPSELRMPVPDLCLHRVPLELALKPSELSSSIPPDATVAVVGASHSAVLVLLNLFKLASTSYPDLKVRWFPRNGLRYAKFEDGWILRDNTGLKGAAAEFARAHLEDDVLPHSEAGKFISKHDCSGGYEKEIMTYEENLPGCTHIVSATGFTPDAVPLLSQDGRNLHNADLVYDNLNGGFMNKKGEQIKGLFGAGIAFPERVTDPLGNQELNVGMWKFMKYLKRVVPEWIEK